MNSCVYSREKCIFIKLKAKKENYKKINKKKRQIFGYYVYLLTKGCGGITTFKGSEADTTTSLRLARQSFCSPPPLPIYACNHANKANKTRIRALINNPLPFFSLAVLFYLPWNKVLFQTQKAFESENAFFENRRIKTKTEKGRLFPF